MSENIWIKVILPSNALDYHLALPAVPRIGERFNCSVYCEARSKMIVLQGIVNDVVWTEKAPLVYLKKDPPTSEAWSKTKLKATKGQ